MRTVLRALAALSIALPTESSDMKNEEQLIDEELARCDDFSDSWLATEVTAEQIVKESETLLARYMELFRETLRQNGLGEREDLLNSKDQMFEGWRRQRAIFLRHLGDQEVVAFRYDGGENEPCGYVLLKQKKPFRILTVRINRPDPNIGNVEIPFP